MTEVKTRNPLAVDSGGVPTFYCYVPRKDFPGSKRWESTTCIDISPCGSLALARATLKYVRRLSKLFGFLGSIFAVS